MGSDQHAIGEAIASLTARLVAAGLDDAPAIAHEYVNDMLRNGWRPRALPVTYPTSRGTCPPPPDALATIRAAIAAAKAEETL